MVKVVSVKFLRGNKPYYFSPCKERCEKGTGVIVETAKGLEYAVVLEPEREVEEEKLVSPLKPVVRVATERDKELLEKNSARRDECLKIAQEKIEERGLEMKPVDCEISFDGSRITIFFSAEHRVDFRELIKDLSSAYHMRIELRQINIREEIQRIGGLAPCGRECCCSGCMEEPVKVSVKMAKNQGLSLNPQKISGLCGRLMCCLAYENEYYSEVCKKVPKIGGEAETPDGTGTVVNVNMLKMMCKVKFEKGDTMTYRDYAVDEIRFMRGNVVMGKLEDDEEGDDDDVLPDEDNKSASPDKKGGDKNRQEKRRAEKGDMRRAENGGEGDNRSHNKKNRHGKPHHKPDNQNENAGDKSLPQQGKQNRNRQGGAQSDGNPSGGGHNKKHRHRPKQKNNTQKV